MKTDNRNELKKIPDDRLIFETNCGFCRKKMYYDPDEDEKLFSHKCSLVETFENAKEIFGKSVEKLTDISWENQDSLFFGPM